MFDPAIQYEQNKTYPRPLHFHRKVAGSLLLVLRGGG